MKHLLVILVLVFCVPALASEHGGKEHGGKPTPSAPKKEEMKRKKQEEPNKKITAPGEKKEKEEEMENEEEEKDESSLQSFSADEIKVAMLQHIELMQEKGNGVFLIRDPKENFKELKLKFVKIHDPVRIIEGKGYFACTDFYLVGKKEKLYDLDFWLNPKNGELEVTDTKIHKDPQLVNGKWTKVPRYTFINDKPVAVR